LVWALYLMVGGEALDDRSVCGTYRPPRHEIAIVAWSATTKSGEYTVRPSRRVGWGDDSWPLSVAGMEDPGCAGWVLRWVVDGSKVAGGAALSAPAVKVVAIGVRSGRFGGS